MNASTIWSCQPVSQVLGSAGNQAGGLAGRRAGRRAVSQSGRQVEPDKTKSVNVLRASPRRDAMMWMLLYEAHSQSCGRSLVFYAYLIYTYIFFCWFWFWFSFLQLWSAQMCAASYGDKPRRWQLLQTFLIKLKVGTLMRCRKCCCLLALCVYIFSKMYPHEHSCRCNSQKKDKPQVIQVADSACNDTSWRLMEISETAAIIEVKLSKIFIWNLDKSQFIKVRLGHWSIYFN